MPDTVGTLPTTPLVGLTEMSASTVNTAEALTTESEAFIGWAPFGAAGIVIVHV